MRLITTTKLRANSAIGGALVTPRVTNDGASDVLVVAALVVAAASARAVTATGGAAHRASAHRRAASAERTAGD